MLGIQILKFCYKCIYCIISQFHICGWMHLLAFGDEKFKSERISEETLTFCTTQTQKTNTNMDVFIHICIYKMLYFFISYDTLCI